MLMGNESVMRRADVLGHQLLSFDKPIAPSETLAKLMAVTKEDVEKMARKLLAKKPLVTALGPQDKLEAYESIVARLKL